MSPTTADLLQHSDWLRDLARSLTGDSATAEDLVQDTWLKAMQSPPRHGENPRGWLATVLRNSWRQRGRRDERRGRREAVRAVERMEPATDEVVGRLQLQRTIVEAVLALDEPYRTPITKRFFDGKPPRVVARELGRPVATVNSQLARGLERLRCILDGRFGDRRAWSVVLLRIPGVAKAEALVPLSGLLFMTADLWKALAAAVVVVALGLFSYDIFLSEPQAAGVPHEATGSVVVVDAPPDDRSSSKDGAQPERTAATVEPRPDEQPGEEAWPAEVRGRVVDSFDRPLAGVRVVADCFDEKRHAVSDDEGRFVIAAKPGFTEVTTDDARFAAIVDTEVPAKDLEGYEALIVAAPARRLTVNVVDEADAAIVGATVWLEYEPHVRKIARVLDDSREKWLSAKTDAQGRVVFESVAAIPDLQMRAYRGDYEDAVRSVDSRAASVLRAVLRKPRMKTRGVLKGRVLMAGGGPVVGAHVVFGHQKRRTDKLGGFRFSLDTARRENDSIYAVAKGFLPARLERPRSGAERRDWPSDVVLVLDERAKTIRGRVVDESGSPVAGARVFVTPYAAFVEDGGILTSLEHFLGSNGKTRDFLGVSWSWVVSEADGGFVIDGLLDREYGVRALMPRTLLNATKEGVAAGSTGLEIVLPSKSIVRDFVGRVVDRHGDGMSGVEVTVGAHAGSIRYEGGGAHDQPASGVSATTDAKGVFRMKNVPQRDVFFSLDGRAIVPMSVPISEMVENRGTRASHAIVAARRVHVHVELSDRWKRAKEILVRDVKGRALSIVVGRASDSELYETLELVDGAASTFIVPDTARTLELRVDGEKIHSVPLTLDRDGVNKIRI